MAILGPYGFKETHTDDWVGERRFSMLESPPLVFHLLIGNLDHFAAWHDLFFSLFERTNE